LISANWKNKSAVDFSNVFKMLRKSTALFLKNNRIIY